MPARRRLPRPAYDHWLLRTQWIQIVTLLHAHRLLRLSNISRHIRVQHISWTTLGQVLLSRQQPEAIEQTVLQVEHIINQ